jgi:cytokinin riboside 5'-monophosphate phosphoribohydrolase
MTSSHSIERPARSLSVCVFAGARSGTDDRAAAAAEDLGGLLGKRGHQLVYGGGGSGLMGTVAWSAHHAGAEVVGIIPRFLYELERGIAAPPQTLQLTDTLAERKTEMLRQADAFVALPGGFGTMDEVLEVLSLACLAQHLKPLVLLDVGDAWRTLRAVLQDVCSRGYADLGRSGLQIVREAADAVAAVEGAKVPGGALC